MEIHWARGLMHSRVSLDDVEKKRISDNAGNLIPHIVQTTA
jgi:hypothetical protein